MDESEARFLEHILDKYRSRRGDQPNYDVHAILNAIQCAFTKNWKERWGSTIPVSPDLLMNLAACAWVALDYNKDERINWSGLHDSVLSKSLRWFMVTIRQAIVENRTVQIDGKTMHGCFEVPQWFAEKCQEDEHERRMHFKPYLAHSS